VADWLYSTFHRHVKNGVYPRDWAGGYELGFGFRYSSTYLAVAHFKDILPKDIGVQRIPYEAVYACVQQRARERQKACDAIEPSCPRGVAA